MQDPIKAVYIWSGWLRLSHWATGFGVLFLILSGWAMRLVYANQDFWRAWHTIAGQLVFAALLLRFMLFFKRGSSHWSQLLCWRPAAIWQTLWFYLSFTRQPLPAWYAHNPAWKPLYLLIYLLLGSSAISGLLYAQGIVLGLPVSKLHQSLATLIILLAGAHIFTALLHDWKGQGAFISAMLSGTRYFHYNSRGNGGDVHNVQISVDSIGKPVH